MSDKRVYLDFQDGSGLRDITAYVIYNTLTVTRYAFNDSYQAAQNECSFQLQYNAGIFGLIVGTQKDILIQVEQDVGVETYTIFTGHIPYSRTWSYNGILDNTIIQLSATDDSDYLNVEVGDVVYTNCAICDPLNPTASIVHLLATIAGFGSRVASSVTIPATIAKFAPNSEDDTVYETLNLLLYEYGYTLSLDGEGNILPIHWNIAEPTATAHTFNETNIIESVAVTDKAQGYDSIEVIHYDLLTKEAVRLYTDDKCGYADDGTFEGYAIPAGYYYPPKTNVIDTTTGTNQVVEQEYTDDAITYLTNKAIEENLDYNYTNFDSNFSGIVATANHFLEYRVEAGVALDREIYGNKKAEIRYLNSSGDFADIFYNNIYGDVWYKSSERKIVVYPATSDNKDPKKVTLAYVYDEALANAFAQGLAKQIEVGNIKHVFSSEDRVLEGTLVQITLANGTNTVAFVQKLTFSEEDELYYYECVSTAFDRESLVSQTVTENVYVNNESPFAISISAGQLAVPYGVDGYDYTNTYVDIFIGRDGIDYTPDWTIVPTPTGVTGSLTGHRYTITDVTGANGSVLFTASRTGRNDLTVELTVTKSMIEEALTNLPSYKGRWYGAHPALYISDDWWLVYNDEGATGGDNVPRGIYYVLEGVITLIDPTDTSPSWAKYRAATLEDVLWASNNGYTLVGTVDDPEAVYGVNVMQYMAVNNAFVNYLGTNKIRLSSDGALIGGSRYNDAGTVINALATGVYIGANGTVKFESHRGGLVIDSATGTVTYTGVNVDLTDSALVSYEEGSATPKSFSHENLALVVRDFASAEKVRLQYEDATELWGGRGLGGEVDFVSSWLKGAAMGASSSLSALAITHIGIAMNRGTTALALANVGGIAKTTDTLSGSYIRWTSGVYGSKLYIPIYNQNIIEIYDMVTGDVTTDTLSGSHSRRTSAIYGSKLYIPISGENLIEIYDLITGDVTTDTLSGAYTRLTSAIYGSKLYIPIYNQNILEIYDLVTGDITPTTLSGAYTRLTCAIYDSKLYIPIYNQNIIEIYDMVTGDVTPTTLSGVYERPTSVVYGSKLYIPIYNQNILEIYDMVTGDVTTDTLSGVYERPTSVVYGSKLYIPIYNQNILEIYDMVTGDVTPTTLSGAYARLTCAIYDSKLYIPQDGTDDMDIVQLPYTVGLSYASGSWSAAAEVPVYGLENITVTKMADGRHMVVGEKTAGVWYCIRATDGSYGSCVELQANAHSPTVTALPTGLTVCAYIHTATSYIGRKAWSGTAWGTNTSIELAATRPEFCVTEDYATLTYILTSTSKAFVIDCSDGTFTAATDTTVTAVRAQCQILPDLTYRLTYQLSTGYLYAAVGASLTSWTATALETSGVTDFSVGILGTGETTLLYAKSALLRRVDTSAYAGTNETKLMRAGMGIVSVAEDAGGKYYTLADGEILRPQSAGGSMLRARVTFNGTVEADVSGTYSISGTTCTVTMNGHGHIPGHYVWHDYTSGSGSDGKKLILTVTENTYTVASSSMTTSGNVTEKRALILGSGNIHSIGVIAKNVYLANFLTAMPDAYYTPVLTSNERSEGDKFPKIDSSSISSEPFVMTAACLQVVAYSGAHSSRFCVAIFG